jgi:hypothetical protein
MKSHLPLLLMLPALPALAHHGVAGVGAAALEGPGAPVESASSATLPAGKTLLYMKLDHAQYKSIDPTDTQADWSRYWMTGIGHGFTPWFSAYLFAPYNSKVDTNEPPLSVNPAPTPRFDTHGWADLSVMGQLAFKHEPGEGLKLIPDNESLDDLEDWHFTVFAGSTIPHGDPNLRDRAGNIDPGKSTGFGKPSYSLGFTATRMLTRDLTFNLEISAIRFQEYTYADKQRMRFGDEDRFNASLNWRLWGSAEARARLDGVIEAQYLKLGNDIATAAPTLAVPHPVAIPDPVSGGEITYLMPGARLYKDNMSFAFGVKLPVSARLNEQPGQRQQGAEGTEKWRAIFSASILF